jgi:hypothetical protein
METSVKTPIKNAQLLFSILLVIVVWTVGGCATSTPDPLTAWKPDFDFSREADQEIVSDYQDYIKELPLRQSGFVGSVDFFKDETGQHAVNIKIGRNGTWWDHILIYNKQNKRIKTVISKNGGYRS